MKLNKTPLLCKRQCVVAALLVLLVACAGEEDSIEVSPLPVIQAEFEPNQIWRAKVGEGVKQYYSQLSPVYAYDKIFAAERNGKVVALEPNTGKIIWEQELGKEQSILISGGLTASYEKIYLGSETGELVALNEQTGEVVWRINTEGEILSKPLADENLIVVHTSRGDLSAFDAETGELSWKITTDVPNLTLRGDSSPSSVGGGVFWGMANGRLGAALLANGNVIWQQPVATPKGATEIDRLVDVDAKPAITGTILYALGYNGQLVAIDLRSGRPMWRRNYSGTKDLVISGDNLYLSNYQDVVYAIDTRSGTELWNNAELKHRQITAPALIDGYLVVGDAEGYLHWLDVSTGDFVAQQAFKGDGIAVPPIAVDSNFLVVTRDGRLHLQSVGTNEEVYLETQENFDTDYVPDLPLE